MSVDKSGDFAESVSLIVEGANNIPPTGNYFAGTGLAPDIAHRESGRVCNARHNADSPVGEWCLAAHIHTENRTRAVPGLLGEYEGHFAGVALMMWATTALRAAGENVIVSQSGHLYIPEM